ncbi:MAG: hypothetical protein ACOX6D_02550 [Thermoguttaceae bacterium]|jgi:hypothetical protein
MNFQRFCHIPEKEVVNAVQNHFDAEPNVKVFRRNVGAVTLDDRFVKFAQAGQADLWGIIKELRCPHCGDVLATGVHLEIECKSATGRLTPAQNEFLKFIRNSGGVAVIAQPVPTADDPTGFRTLKTTLASVDKEVCQSCSRLFAKKGKKDV